MLDLDYGSTSLQWEQAQRMDDATGRHYRARNDTDSIRVYIQPTLCHDSMSGMPFPDSVRITLGDRQLRGCGGMPADLLIHKEWLVEDISKRGLIDFTHLTMQFTPDGRVTGSTGCNRWRASWRLSGEGLTIDAIATTRKSCGEALDLQQQRFMDALAHVHRFDIDQHGKLILHGGTDYSIRATNSSRQ